MNKTISVGGKDYTIRPLTLGEIKRVRAGQKAASPVLLGEVAEWVLGDGSLDGVPFPEVRQIETAIWDLTNGTEETEGN